MLLYRIVILVFFFSSRRRHTRCSRDWSSDVCSSDLAPDREPVETHSTGRDKEKAPQPKWLEGLIFNQSGRRDLNPRPPEIGRASCRKECRSRWSPYH